MVYGNMCALKLVHCEVKLVAIIKWIQCWSVDRRNYLFWFI